MENVLYTDEHIVSAVDLLNDRFVLTNKRLIYNDVVKQTSNTSIGLNNVSGIEYKKLTFGEYKFTDKQIISWTKLAMVLPGIPCVIYVLIASGITDFYSTILGVIIFLGTYLFTGGIIIAILTYAGLNIYNNRTSTPTDRIEIVVRKTDNSLFYNNIYPMDNLEHIKRFVFEFNDTLYSKV